MGREETDNCGLFLVGCHRSGTTLARYFLDSHSALACPPESKFIAGFEAFLRYPQALRGLSQLGITPPRLLAEFGRVTAQFLSEFAATQGKRRWIDKTPNYYRILPLIDAMFGGRARYLFIVRHPLDNVASLHAAPYFVADRLVDPEVSRAVEQHGRTMPGWAHYWLDVNTSLAAFAAQAGGRCCVFKYEDLVCRTESTLERLFRWIGEEPEPEVIARAFTQPHAAGDGDWSIQSTGGVHTKSIGRWLSWPPELRDGVWSVVEPLAATLGYELQSGFDRTVTTGSVVPLCSGDEWWSHAETYYAPPVSLFRITPSVYLSVCRDSERTTLISVKAAQALGHCDGARSLADHAVRVATRMPAEMPSGVATAIEELLGGELLRPVSAGVASRPGEETPGAPLDLIVVVTADRPETLQRGLISATDHFRSCGCEPSIVVIDGSRQYQSASRAAVEAARRTTGVRVTYVGPGEAAALRAALSKVVHQSDVVDFCVTAGDIGSNRNLGLLCTAGRRVLMLDDDVLCDVWSLPASDGRCALAGHDDVHHWEFFSSRDAAVAGVTRTMLGLSAAHGAILGQSLVDVLRGSTESVDVLQSCSHTLATMEIPSRAVVRVTLAGLAGDSARYCSHHVLFRRGGVRERLRSDDFALRTALTTREVHRIAPRLTITHDINAMGYCMGLANNTLLPPFMPMGRGEDSVFGAMLTYVDSGALAAHLPVGIVHDSHRPAAYGDEAMPSARQVRLAELLLVAVQQLSGLPCSDSVQRRLDRLGRHLVDLGQLAAGEFNDFLRTAAIGVRAAKLAELESTLAGDPGFAATWQCALDEYRETLLRSLGSNEFFVPIEFRASRTDPIRACQDWLLRFGESMISWGGLWEAARRLDVSLSDQAEVHGV